MVIAIVSLLCACNEPAPEREWTPADHAQPAQAQPGPDPASEEAAGESEPGGGTERASRALWAVTCAGCHGRDGRGHGEAIPPGAQLPDFTSEAFQHSRSDAQLAQVIRDGKGMMPPFVKKLSEEGVAALVQRVRAFEVPSSAAPAAPQ
ncbi:MAG: c-type cytochrome [Polyangiales bacterium]